MTEENIENTEISEKNEKKECNSDCDCKAFLRGLGVSSLIFLGAFCAFYVLADWYIKSLFIPFSFSDKKIEKLIDRNIKMVDDFVKDNRKISDRSNVIHMERADNYYKVKIDLRAFDNNPNNVHVSQNGNILSIQGRSVKKSKHDEHISEFTQRYIFGDNVKLEDIRQETNGNYYVITVPINKSDD